MKKILITGGTGYLGRNLALFYKNKYNLKNEDFPNSEKLWKGCFSLPIFPDLQENELEHIINSLKEILR